MFNDDPEPSGDPGTLPGSDEDRVDRRRDAYSQDSGQRGFSSDATISGLAKRAPKTDSSPVDWAMSVVSTPPGLRWGDPSSGSVTETGLDGKYRFLHHYNNNPAGLGQTVYIMTERVIWTGHPEFTAPQAEGRIETVRNRFYDTDMSKSGTDRKHGSGVASKIIGSKMGLCPKCTIVWLGLPQTKDGKLDEARIATAEDLVWQLDQIILHVRRNRRQGKAVVSWSSTVDYSIELAAVYKLRKLVPCCPISGYL